MKQINLFLLDSFKPLETPSGASRVCSTNPAKPLLAAYFLHLSPLRSIEDVPCLLLTTTSSPTSFQ